MLHKKDKSKTLFFRESGFKVAELIFNSPHREWHLRELARKTGMSTTAISSSIENLRKFGLINIKNTPITKSIKANLESDAYYHYKQIFNLYRINRYNLTNELTNEFQPKCIVLFGSFAKGEDIEKSDIDILILSNAKKDIDLKEYEQVLARKINLHVLKNLGKASKEFKNEIANGIILYGVLEIIK